MQNPYRTLKIKDGISNNEMSIEIENKTKTFLRLMGDNSIFFKELFSQKNGFKYTGKATGLRETEIEEDLADKFACNIIPKERFMSYKNLFDIKKEIEIEENSQGYEGKFDKRSFYTNVILSQQQRLSLAYERYNRVLENYRKNTNSAEAIRDLEDLYMKMKYEDAIIKLSPEIAARSGRISDPKERREEFIKQLTNHKEYLRLKEAYETISTPRKRQDLDPKLYVVARLGRPELLKVASPKFKEEIISKEREYREQYLEQIAKNPTEDDKESQIPENQNHEYGWGIILDKPSYILQDKRIENSDFEGKLSVKHLGFFSAESLYSKKKLLREKHEKTKIYGTKIRDNGIEYNGRLKLKKRFPNLDVPENMRQYYYRYDSTYQSYMNIYLVSKTDINGKVREDIVFSPVKKSDFDTKYPENFLTNVYFSNFALDIAKQNGGFAGSIEKDSNGLSISTVYNKEEIASALLYQSGTMGKITDRTKLVRDDEDKWKLIDGTDANSILRKSDNHEREITLDE